MGELLVWTVGVFVWGLLWGSFANVVIWRVPRGLSVVAPPSACVRCGAGIRWYHNVPLLGWVALRGSCADCGAPVSARYPLVELCGGLLSLLMWLHVLGPGAARWWDVAPLDLLLVWMMLTYLMIGLLALTVIDLEHALLPHALTGGLALLGVVFALLAPEGLAWRGFVPAVGWLDSVLGFVAGWGVLYLVATGYALATGRVGMGGGDLMLLGAIGAWLGWRALPVVLMWASWQALLVVVVAVLVARVGGRASGTAGTGRPGDAGAGLLRDGSVEGFWEARTAAEARAVDQRASGPVRSGSGRERASARLGLSFGPFLALATLEYVLWGGVFARWMGFGTW